MKKNKKVAIATVSAIITLGSTSLSANAETSAPEMPKEKCYGVVKAGKNDCGTPTHPCASKAKVDSDPQEWLMLPAGLCERLSNGKKNPS